MKIAYLLFFAALCIVESAAVDTAAATYRKLMMGSGSSSRSSSSRSWGGRFYGRHGKGHYKGKGGYYYKGKGGYYGKGHGYGYYYKGKGGYYYKGKGGYYGKGKGKGKPTLEPTETAVMLGTWFIESETSTAYQSCSSTCDSNGLVCNAETAHPLVDTAAKLRYVVEVELGIDPGMAYIASEEDPYPYPEPYPEQNPRVILSGRAVFNSDPVNAPTPSCDGSYERTHRICCCGPTTGMVCRVAPP